MGVDALISNFATLFPELNKIVGAGFLIFVRMLGLMRFAPLLNRKEIPVIVKLAFAFMFTVLLVQVLKPPVPPADASIIFSVAMNYICGALIGYITYCIISTVEAAGDMINMQMGMSSAMVLDPTTSAQVSIVGKFIGLFGLLIFMEIGGVYWVLDAFQRSFEIYPVYGAAIPLEKIVNTDYLMQITSNILYIGLQFASPVLLATMGQDIILGIISKTAPQINVFQLSFLFKPVFGTAILLWILPIIHGIITDYFISFSHIF